jgi:hypothetical protein
MKIDGDTVRTLGSATSMLVAVAGLIWYVASVETNTLALFRSTLLLMSALIWRDALYKNPA